MKPPIRRGPDPNVRPVPNPVETATNRVLNLLVMGEWLSREDAKVLKPRIEREIVKGLFGR